MPDPEFDPLAQHALAREEFFADHEPPDRLGGRDEEIKNLDGLLRYDSEPQATWTLDPGPARPPVTDMIRGGLHEEPAHPVTDPPVRRLHWNQQANPGPRPEDNA